MARITKNLAELAANNMLDKVDKVIQEKRSHLSDFVSKIAVGSIDKRIYDNILLLPKEFVHIKTYLQVNTTYGKSIGISLEKPLRFKSDHYLKVTPDVYELIHSMYDEIEKLNIERKVLKNQIIQTLLKLATFKNVQEKYPEAYSHFPKDSIVVADPIALPIESIQDNINKILKS